MKNICFGVFGILVFLMSYGCAPQQKKPAENQPPPQQQTDVPKEQKQTKPKPTDTKKETKADKKPSLSFVSPKKEAENVSGTMPVTFLWDGQVFALQNPETLQQQLEKNITIKPDIEGRWQVLGTSGILFEPKEAWAFSTEYEIQIPLSACPNCMLEGETSLIHKFQTPRLEIKDLESQDLIQQKPVRIIFNQPVPLESAQTFLLETNTKTENGFETESINFQANFGSIKERNDEGEMIEVTKENIIDLSPETDWPPATEITLTIPEGTTAKEGHLPTKEALSRGFSTIQAFTVERFNAPDTVEQAIHITFSHDVDTADFAQAVKIYPEPAAEIWEDYISQWTENPYKTRWFYLRPPDNRWKANEMYTFVLSEEFKDEYGRTFDEEYKQEFRPRLPDDIKSLFFPTQNRVFAPDTDLIPTFVYSGNLSQINVTLNNVYKQYPLNPSPNAEQLWDLDFRKTFPDELLSDPQNLQSPLKPGKYEVTISVPIPNRTYPQEFQSTFFVSEFSVELKKMADKNFRTYISPYPGETELDPLSIITVSYEGQKAGSDVYGNAKNGYQFEIPEQQYNVVTQVKNGDRIGYGSENFQENMSPWSAQINYDPWRYQQNYTGVIFTDRPLYKQNHKVYIKSIFREQNFFEKNFPLKTSDPEQNYNYEIQIIDPSWETVATLEGQTQGGSLDTQWDIPENAALGQYQIQLRFPVLGEHTENTTFFVSAYRKPKFLINAEFDANQALQEEMVIAKISAEYAFGGALASKPVHYTVTLFGDRPCYYWWGCGGRNDKVLTSGENTLNADGTLEIPINLDFELSEEEAKINWNLLTVNLTIEESTDESSSAEVSIPYFPSNHIVSLDRGHYFYPVKSEVPVTGTLTDLEKNPMPETSVTIQLLQEKWVRSDRKNADGHFYGEWERTEEIIWEENTETTETGKIDYDFIAPEKGGNYIVKVMSKDKKERVASDAYAFWVAGKELKDIKRNEQNRILNLFPEKENYGIDETVSVFVPITDFEVTRSHVTLERGGVLETLTLDPQTNTVDFTTEAWMAPNVFVSVLIEGRDSEGEMDVRWGSAKISVEDPSHQLEVQITPEKNLYRPGDEVTLKLQTHIQNHSGNETQKVGTAAEITIAVVDETLLALRSRPDLGIWKQFLAELPLGVQTTHTLANFMSRSEVQKVYDEIDEIRKRMESGFGGGPGGKGDDFKPRGEFRDTAAFIAKATTDENGIGTVTFTLPDNLTTWNLWGVAHTLDNAFGETETNFQTSLPLLISEVMPNFFQVGDQMEVGLLIRRNQTEQESEDIQVTLTVPSGFEAKVKEKTVEVGEEARVFFDIDIPAKNYDKLIGSEEVTLGFAIESESGLKDSVEIKRTLFPPNVNLAAAESLRIEEETVFAIKPDFDRALASRLMVKVYLSVAGKLKSLIEVTRKMNYGCAEQRLSLTTPTLLQKKFDETMGRSSGEIDTESLIANRDYIENAFARDGYCTWGHCTGGPNVWVTTQILEFSDLWAEYDAPFEEEHLSKAAVWLKNKIMSDCDYRRNWRDCMTDQTRQNAAYVLALREKLEPGDLQFLSQHTDSLEAKLWWLKAARIMQEQNQTLSPAAQKQIVKFWDTLDGHLQARDRYVFWEENEDDRCFYTQNERVSALIFKESLEAGRLEAHQHKMARYLAETKTKYLSGNSALRILESLIAYAEAKEVMNTGAKYEIVQNYDKNLFAGGPKSWAKGTLSELSSEETYQGVIEDEKFQGVELKTSNDKPYYADIELHEVLPVDAIEPVQKGFFLERALYELEDEDFENSLSELKVGENYVVRLKLIVNASHRQVIVEDRIPAGAEFVNFDFENADQTLSEYAGERNNNENQCYGWCLPQFEHKEFHNERARYFADYIAPGTYEIKYIIKARLPGKFDVLPAKVEEMYFPEVFSTTSGKVIEIVR